jgi:hypothetical protein
MNEYLGLRGAILEWIEDRYPSIDLTLLKEVELASIVDAEVEKIIPKIVKRLTEKSDHAKSMGGRRTMKITKFVKDV